MASGRARRIHYIAGVVLFTWLLTVAWLSASQPFAVETSAAQAHIRVHTWTFSAGEFHQVDNGYLSPLERAPFSFTAAGVHVQPSAVGNALPTVELRLKADPENWSPWYPIEDFEPEADGRIYGENLVAWPDAREVQVRVRSPSPLQEMLHDVTVVAIDAGAGPTASQAALSARARTETQMFAAEGDPGVPQPVVISRAEWGANESWMTWSPHYAPVDKVIVHHTVSGGGVDPAAEVRAIYYYHAVSRGWGDIGYNFLVDRFGNVYEGRYGGPDVIGAHVAYWNEGSIGVSVLGCYDYGACGSPRVPTAATLTAITDLVAWASSRQAIDPRALENFSNGYSTVTNYVLAGHRNYGVTVCPGGNLYAELPGLRQMAWERLPEYDVRFGWQDTPSSLEAGQHVTVYPNLYNHGRLVWSDSDGVRLGYRWIKDGQVVAENTAAARVIPGAVVKFGEMTALVAQLTAPTTSGIFTLRWDLYRDGAGWFADQPAPTGRSQPLDLTVEITSAPDLDVRLEPPSVPAGTPLHLDITLQGSMGQVFEARTRLPPRIEYILGSGKTDIGYLYPESDEVIWSGTLGAATAQASFDVFVSFELNAPVALSTTTTLNLLGYSPQVVARWFIVNGYHSFIPLAVQTWSD